MVPRMLVGMLSRWGRKGRRMMWEKIRMLVRRFNVMRIRNMMRVRNVMKRLVVRRLGSLSILVARLSQWWSKGRTVRRLIRM